MMRTGFRVGSVVLAMAMLAVGCAETGRESAVAPVISVPEPSPPTTAASAASTTTVAPVKPTRARALTAFSSCSSMLRHFKREAMRAVTPFGLTNLPGVPKFTGRAVLRRDAVTANGSSGGGQVSAGSSAESESMAADDTATGLATTGGEGYSGTNVQEQGVDEPDLVKSDGRRLVTLERGRLVVVDISSPSPRPLGTLDLGAGNVASELLLAGDRVVVFGYGSAYGPGPSMADEIVRVSPPVSTVRVVDIATPTAPVVVATIQLEGHYVSARLASGVVRLVIVQELKGPSFAFPNDGHEELTTLELNRAAIRRSTVKDWLPTYTLERPGRAAVTAPLAPCTAVLRPKAFSGLGTVSVLTLDPADPKPASPACVLGGGRIVYAGPANLYVATEQWTAGDVTNTELHRFAVPGREPAAYVASGAVKGTVLNQFSMSELDGRLRVASTVRTARGETENFVHVLEAQDGRLVTVGALGGLGHEGETIQSVRFIGSRGYVVTFRQTDPLYVIDLQNPRRPQLRGELQVPGFSSYLHPLSDSVLLGVGQGPGDRGGPGLQLSLFDVRDPAHPVRLADKVFEFAQSAAQHDHHAFLWWAPAGRLVLPVQEYEGGEPFTGAIVVDVDPAVGFGAVNRVTHQDKVAPGGSDGSIHRAMVAGPNLLTLSGAGLLASDVTSLADRVWLAW